MNYFGCRGGNRLAFCMLYLVIKCYYNLFFIHLNKFGKPLRHNFANKYREDCNDIDDTQLLFSDEKNIGLTKIYRQPDK